MHEREVVHSVATLYYVQGQTMASIAARLAVSRSTVSRMLEQARESGIVDIKVNPVNAGSPFAEMALKRFGIRVHSVSVRRNAPTMHRLDQTARVAARLLADWFGDGMILGVAWGTTVSAVSGHLPPKATRGSQVVQLNGAASRRSSGVGYAGQIMDLFGTAFDAEATYFTVPAFFDYADTKTALWREVSVQRVLSLQRQADIAVFGVGALRGQLVSHVYSGGYLHREELQQLASERVVGDICTVFVRQDGTWEDIELNMRASGPNPRSLASIRRRVCVVAGSNKVRALIAAMHAQVPTDIIIDDQTAAEAADLIRQD